MVNEESRLPATADDEADEVDRPDHRAVSVTVSRSNNVDKVSK